MSLDTIISRLSPAWAARRAERRLRARVTEEREQALLALAAHDAAEHSRNTADWNTRLLSSDQAVVGDQPTAIARARDAVRNDWAAVSIVDGHVRHIVGIGITPRANARHPGTGKSLDEFNKAADRIWNRWARDKNLCHTERHWNFTGLEALTVREEVTAGISIALFNYTPRADHVGVHIQIIEFEQLVAWLVKNPDTGFWIRNGVEIDDFGAPVALWVFTKGHPLEYIQGRMAYTRIPFDRVLMTMRPERVRQSQGMGRLSAVLQPLHHNKLYELYSVLRARAECVTGVSIESDLNASAPGSQAGAFGGASATAPGGRPGIVLQPNMINRLAPGEHMNFVAPTTPGSQYAPFSRTQGTKFAAGAGLDYPTVARDFSGMSYSGQLQGRLETWAETDPAQQRMVDDFCRPIRDKVITMAILEGRLPAPNFDNPEWRAAYLEAEWRGPAKGSINPAQDRAADKIALDYKLTTRREILNEENLDVREVISQLSDEYRLGEEQDPPILFPDAQQNPNVSPNEPRPGAQDDRGLSLAANVGQLLDRIEKLEQANVALAAGWDESKHPRVPAGQKGGGEFGTKGGGPTEKSKAAHEATGKAMKASASGDDKAAGEAHREAQEKHKEAAKAHEDEGNGERAADHLKQAANHGEAAKAHEDRAAAPGYSEHTAAKAELTEKIKAAMDAGNKAEALKLVNQLSVAGKKQGAAAEIGKREWWHVPPEDKSAYAKRGKFYSSSFEEAEFYGIRSDAKPERVEVDRPLVGDELHIEKTLLGRHASADLPDPGDKEFYKARTGLDHELATEARRAGYDAIALLTPKGFAAFQKTGRLPKSVELNTLSDVDAGAGHVEALPLPPKDAPEELKNLYRERQREYTHSKTPGISEEEKKKHLDRVAELKTQIDKARKEHPEWFAKGPGQPKPPADKPGAPPANPPGAKTAKGLKQQFKEHQGVSLRFMHLDHEVDPDERPQDFVNKTYFEMADRVDGALTATRSQFGSDFKLRCERSPLRKLEVSDAGTLVYRGKDGRQHSDAVGLYDPSDNHITVAAAYLDHRQYDSPRVGRWVVDDTFEGTVRHEFGHYVMERLLSNKELTLWMQKFNDVDLNPTAPKNAIAKHISKYAATNSKECFAESFCAYTHPGYRRGMLPPEFEDFFDHVIFEKTEKQIGESRALLDSPWRK